MLEEVRNGVRWVENGLRQREPTFEPLTSHSRSGLLAQYSTLLYQMAAASHGCLLSIRGHGLSTCQIYVLSLSAGHVCQTTSSVPSQVPTSSAPRDFEPSGSLSVPIGASDRYPSTGRCFYWLELSELM